MTFSRQALLFRLNHAIFVEQGAAILTADMAPLDGNALRFRAVQER